MSGGRATPEGAVEIPAVDPVASMQAIRNPALAAIAGEARAAVHKNPARVAPGP